MKKISSLLFSILLILGLVKVTSANTNFQTDLNVEYKVKDSGSVTITNTITIKNLKSDYFPKQYVMNLTGVSPENVKAYERGTLLKTSTKKNNNQSQISVDFYENSVGRGTAKTFIVSFEDNSLIKKTGEIWEVVLPKVYDPENYNTYKVVLSIPSSMGERAYISPEPSTESRLEGRSIYKFEDYHKLPSGVTAGFGVFQALSFSLTYHLEGGNKETISEIALPPDTSTQKMFYENIHPEPQAVTRDQDGNWLAKYQLKSDEVLDVTVKGFVQIFALPNSKGIIEQVPQPHDLLPTSYWQSDDPKILEIANKLHTPKDIYNFVIQTLQYNFERVNQGYTRYGALKALNSPSDSLCMEFTDLFIAIARASGIPAREINGYAYSQNPLLEPVYLANDVLHSWPEYWDSVREMWVPIDPTWGDTTGGVDFFNKFDLRHFAFVIHSTNPVLPYSAGLYKNSESPIQDVRVSFANLPSRQSLNIKIESTRSVVFPFFVDKQNIVLTNQGGSALYNFPIKTNIQYQEKKETLSAFLPFEKKTVSGVLRYGLFGLQAPESIFISAGYLTENIPVDKSYAIIGQLIVTSLILFVIVLSVTIKNQKYNITSLRNKILSILSKNVRKILPSKYI